VKDSGAVDTHDKIPVFVSRIGKMAAALSFHASDIGRTIDAAESSHSLIHPFIHLRSLAHIQNRGEMPLSIQCLDGGV
jgi:hypothetical protein